MDQVEFATQYEAEAEAADIADMQSAIRNPQYLDYYRQMLLIRRCEEQIGWLFSRNLTMGTAHLSIGQEASAVGALAAIAPDDYVVSTHRGHGHLLAKGDDPAR